MWIRTNGASEWRNGGVLASAPAAGKRAGRVCLALAWLLMVALGGGCKKSAPARVSAPPETVARVHWLGKQRLAADTNAASVMEIWNLAESRKLEAQTLDKLALGWLAGSRGSAMSNQVSLISNQSPVTNHSPNSPAPRLSFGLC